MPFFCAQSSVTDTNLTTYTWLLESESSSTFAPAIKKSGLSPSENIYQSRAFQEIKLVTIYDLQQNVPQNQQGLQCIHKQQLLQVNVAVILQTSHSHLTKAETRKMR